MSDEGAGAAGAKAADDAGLDAPVSAHLPGGAPAAAAADLPGFAAPARVGAAAIPVSGTRLEAESAEAFPFRKIVICGVGLIGGSLALALRRAERVAHGHDEDGAPGASAARRPRCEIVGVGRGIASVARAVGLGVVDSACTFDDVAGLARALDGADLVVLAVPVAQTSAVLDVLLPHLQLQTVVTDAGSTKIDVIAAARHSLSSRIGQFVPAHPIAGRERSGVDAAIEDLYDDRNVVVCSLAENADSAIAQVEAMWRATGARLHRMNAAQHDTVFASVSHLPHLLSFALVDQILDSAEAGLKFSFAAGGFRDFTRIAASSPEMWCDIFLANREALLVELDGYTAGLARLRAAIEAGDRAGLNDVFTRARDARQRWTDQPESGTDAGDGAAGKGRNETAE